MGLLKCDLFLQTHLHITTLDCLIKTDNHITGMQVLLIYLPGSFHTSSASNSRGPFFSCRKAEYYEIMEDGCHSYFALQLHAIVIVYSLYSYIISLLRLTAHFYKSWWFDRAHNNNPMCKCSISHIFYKVRL